MGQGGGGGGVARCWLHPSPIWGGQPRSPIPRHSHRPEATCQLCAAEVPVPAPDRGGGGGIRPVAPGHESRPAGTRLLYPLEQLANDAGGRPRSPTCWQPLSGENVHGVGRSSTATAKWRVSAVRQALHSHNQAETRLTCSNQLASSSPSCSRLGLGAAGSPSGVGWGCVSGGVGGCRNSTTDSDRVAGLAGAVPGVARSPSCLCGWEWAPTHQQPGTGIDAW